MSTKSLKTTKGQTERKALKLSKETLKDLTTRGTQAKGQGIAASAQCTAAACDTFACPTIGVCSF